MKAGSQTGSLAPCGPPFMSYRLNEGIKSRCASVLLAVASLRKTQVWVPLPPWRQHNAGGGKWSVDVYLKSDY